MIVIPVDDAVSFDRQAIARLRYSDAECEAIHRESLVTALLPYVALALTGTFNWILPLALVITFFATMRYLGLIHGLVHARPRAREVPPLLLLLPVPMLPFAPCFSGAQRYHLLHHKLSLAPGDPENTIVSGRSRLLIFLKCSLIVEWWWYCAFKAGWDRHRFLSAWAVRFGLLASLVYFAGWSNVAWFLLSARGAPRGGL
jgi:hypothetical protein